MNNSDIESFHERERKLHSPSTNPDIQEAMSRRYSDDVVILLPLKSGNYGVFNNLRELCGIATQADIEWCMPPTCWRRPPPPQSSTSRATIDLEELGLL